MTTKDDPANGNDGLTIQRGGESFRLEKSNERFVVKKRSTAARGSLEAAQANPAVFPDLRLQVTNSFGEMEVYSVRGDSLDGAMTALRERSPDVYWCTHVYHMPGDPEGLMVPTDQIYAEFNAGADENAINQLLDEHGLELRPADDGNPNAFVLKLTGASTKNPIKIANALAMSAHIIVAEPDFAVKTDLKAYRPTDTLFPSQWHLENRGGIAMTAGADVAAPDAWEVTRGERSTLVAVIDDSVQIDHPELSAAGKIVAPIDFGQNDIDPSPVATTDKHGTACAGVAVAEENGEGVVGVAPNCGLIPIRWNSIVTDQSIRDWFDHARTNGAAVISCSWGIGGNVFTLSTSMRNTIHRAATEGRGGRGCVVVFAAGNDNRPVNGKKAGVLYREGFAVHPDVIAVSASTSRDLRSNYSNYGPEIWVCAPSSGAGGRSIVTTDRTGTAGYSSGDYTTTFGGTSSSTPLVAGICALMLSINPELTSAEVKEILRDTAEKIDQANGNYDPQGHSEWYGWGRVHAFRAVREAQRRVPSPPGWFLRTLTWLVRAIARFFGRR